MLLRKVISGGQTGADRAGIDAARELGIETGGVAPAGFRTTEGADISLKDLGLIESPSYDYRPRTEINVFSSDGTIIFSRDMYSKGTILTKHACYAYKKTIALVTLLDKGPDCDLDTLTHWIESNRIEVLNIAGNSERSAPGIYEQAYKYFVEVFATILSR